MRSGNLKHKIDFTTPVKTKNDLGEKEETFEVVTSAYANIIPINSREYFASKQVNADITHKIELRYIDGITTKMQIVHGSRKFQISAPPINIREANKVLQIMATEIIV